MLAYLFLALIISYSSFEYQKTSLISSSYISNSTTCISVSGLKPTLCLRLMMRPFLCGGSTTLPSLTQNDDVVVNSWGNMMILTRVATPAFNHGRPQWKGVVVLMLSLLPLFLLFSNVNDGLVKLKEGVAFSGGRGSFLFWCCSCRWSFVRSRRRKGISCEGSTPRGKDTQQNDANFDDCDDGGSVQATEFWSILHKPLQLLLTEPFPTSSQLVFWQENRTK